MPDYPKDSGCANREFIEGIDKKRALGRNIKYSRFSSRLDKPSGFEIPQSPDISPNRQQH